MIAPDTNLLVYAHHTDSPFYESASRLLHRLVRGKARWAIPWPCVHEFISVVTHPHVFKIPTTLADALSAIRSLKQMPQAQLLSEDDGYLELLTSLATTARFQGPMIHDARIAALCLNQGVTELWSADRDFSRFAALKVVNPLLG